VKVEKEEIVAKDVILVLDTSGSMRGDKLLQAKEALEFILASLNEDDRFSIISFSTGVRAYADELVPARESREALRFVRDLRAVGGTNIDRALLEALKLTGGERPQIIMFLTDGLATEGVIETDRIIANVARAASASARIFTFGVGDDVNTLLLDTVAQEHKGASAYVRPGEDIEAEVSSFYAKVSSPLLADLELDFENIWIEDTYPYPLPDLFAGAQLAVVGRYRRGGNTDITLRGTIDGQERAFVYQDNHFRSEGGASFIPRLWATRKVGYLLNEVRLHGESRELIDEIVDLSVRYGIMTPYTSFLIDEEEDALTYSGREAIVDRELAAAPLAREAPAFGAGAVEKSITQNSLRTARSVPGSRYEQVRHMGDKTFVLRDGRWIDTVFNPDEVTTSRLAFGSQDYFDLLLEHPEWGAYLSLGEQLIVVLDGTAYEVLSSGEIPEPTPVPPRVYSDNLILRLLQWVQSVFD
jgi:Ca-activated chloride channel family protein